MKKSFLITSTLIAFTSFKCYSQLDTALNLEEITKVIHFDDINSSNKKKVNSTSSEFLSNSLKQLKIENLNLPDHYKERTFVSNAMEFYRNPQRIVGKVGKYLSNGKFEVYQNAIIDSLRDKTKSENLTDNLVELQYDNSIGASIQYLIANGNIKKDKGMTFVLSDVSQALLDSKIVNIPWLKNTYKTEDDLENYYIVEACIATEIIHREYNKIDVKAGFNGFAVQINGNYYSSNTSATKNYKVGLRVTKLKEYLKGL